MAYLSCNVHMSASQISHMTLSITSLPNPYLLSSTLPHDCVLHMIQSNEGVCNKVYVCVVA